MSYRVVVTDQVFPDVDTERALLSEIGASLEVATGDRDAVLAVARDADALLNTYLPLDADFVAALERCKVIARYGIGVDNVALDAARDRGIVVTNVPDYCVEEVAAHTLALLLSLLRKLPESQASLAAGGWGVDAIRPVRRLSETTVGLVGIGRIGGLVARWLQALGVRVVAHDPFVARHDTIALLGLDELLATADAVCLHCPLTPENRGLIGAAQLAAMKSDAVLVNTSRGPLVVLADLLDALRAGTIRGAALDVYEVEPPDASQLVGVPGLIATPHTAFYSESALAESQRKAATQVRKVLTGEPPTTRSPADRGGPLGNESRLTSSVRIVSSRCSSATCAARSPSPARSASMSSWWPWFGGAHLVAARLQPQRRVGRGAVAQPLQQPDEPRRGDPRRQRGVEAAVEVGPLAHVGLVVHDRHELGGAVEDLGRVLGRRPAHRLGLQQLAHVVDVTDLVVRELLDDAAAMRVELDQPLGRQVAQRLAHGGGADLQLLGDVPLHETGAARQRPPEDRLAERVADHLVRGLPRTGQEIQLRHGLTSSIVLSDVAAASRPTGSRSARARRGR